MVLDEIWNLYSPFFKGFLGPKCNTGGLHSPSPSPSGFSTLNSRHHRSRQYSHPHHHPRLNRLGKADSNSTSCHDTGTRYDCIWMKCGNGGITQMATVQAYISEITGSNLGWDINCPDWGFFLCFPSVSWGKCWILSQIRPWPHPSAPLN
jgi:hypothetical protein